MGQAHATKTLRQPLEHRPGVWEWFATTAALFNEVAAFYHPGAIHPPAFRQGDEWPLAARQPLR